MGLISLARGPISTPAPDSEPARERIAFPILWSAFQTLLIGAPWLRDGYLFGTDWPGPRRLDFPTEVSSSYVLRALLAAASWTVSAQTAGKLFVIAILFGAALTSYRAVPARGFVPRAAGSLVFVVNPFVYGRLHYGQLFLLAAYAALPWFAMRIRELALDPRWPNAVLASVSLTLLGILGPQVFLMGWLLAGVVLLLYVLARRPEDRSYAKRLMPQALLTALIALAGSAYWIVPLVAGRGSEGATLAATGSGDLAAYAAIPDPHLGLVPNLLGLYGFWAEGSGRFTSMKDFVPLWPFVLVVILAVCVLGAFTTCRVRRHPLSPFVTALLITAAIAVVLEAGVSSQITSGLVRWLDSNLSPYRGMRDSGKWAAMLALAYSQLVGVGAAHALEWVRRRASDPLTAEWRLGAVAALLLGLPLYYGNGLLFGMHGEITPSQYPAGWYAADRVLAADLHPGRALFLPWHEYMSLSFVKNQNSVVGPPAPAFFSIPVVVSADPEVPGVLPPADQDQTAISRLVREGGQGQWAQALARDHVKYVLLAKEVDWDAYAYLEHEPDLVRVGDYGSIVLYRDQLVS